MPAEILDTVLKRKFDESSRDSDNNISPEYYIRIEKTFNELIEIRIDYKKAIKKLQQFVKDLWRK